MHRQCLLNKLEKYHPDSLAQQEIRGQFITFVKEFPNCFERTNLIGHITGSAWVISEDLIRVALIHHKKLKKWMQPGGHSDGNPDTLEVAKREAVEETGLEELAALSEEIFDLDIHEIPERGSEPAHLHYDVRFIFRVSGNHQLGMNEEVTDLKWVYLNDVLQMNLETSVLRMAVQHQERLKSYESLKRI